MAQLLQCDRCKVTTPGSIQFSSNLQCMQLGVISEPLITVPGWTKVPRASGASVLLCAECGKLHDEWLTGQVKE